MIKWIATYILGNKNHFIRFLITLSVIGVIIFFVFNFSCNSKTPIGEIGSKPVDAKIDISK